MVIRMTTLGKWFTQTAVWGLEKFKLVPVGTYDVGEALKKGNQSFSLLSSGHLSGEILVTGRRSVGSRRSRKSFYSNAILCTFNLVSLFTRLSLFK